MNLAGSVVSIPWQASDLFVPRIASNASFVISIVIVSLVGFKWPFKGVGLMARAFRHLTPQNPASVKCGADWLLWFSAVLSFIKLSKMDLRYDSLSCLRFTDLEVLD